MSEPYRTTRRVEFVDTDMAGIVHFSNFFRWMESAELDFLKARGLSFQWEQDAQTLAVPRVSAQCDYLKPVRFEELRRTLSDLYSTTMPFSAATLRTIIDGETIYEV